MRVLAIPGSLRNDSYNAKLLYNAAELFPEDVVLDLWGGLKNVPPYDEDDDGVDAPDAVAELRDAIARADAVLIATPEYNHSIPGQLKNAFDWVSRPIATNPMRNKPVAVIGTSTGAFGGVWAQAELRKVIAALGARVLEVELAVPHAQEHFDERGRLTDGNFVEQLTASPTRSCGRRGARCAPRSRRVGFRRVRAPAHRRLPLRRRPLRGDRAARLGRLLPLHAVPAADGNGRVAGRADRARLAARPLGRGAHPGLRAGRRLPEGLLLGLRLVALEPEPGGSRVVSSGSARSTTTRASGRRIASSSRTPRPGSPSPTTASSGSPSAVRVSAASGRSGPPPGTRGCEPSPQRGRRRGRRPRSPSTRGRAHRVRRRPRRMRRSLRRRAPRRCA